LNRQLRAVGLAGPELDIYDGDDITKATGLDNDTDQSRKGRVYQLTGFADPVYAEAYVTVHDYDIVLEILLVNRTPQTLTNLTVELATMGDLRLVERPQSHTIGPLDQRNIRANIKVCVYIYMYIYCCQSAFTAASMTLICTHQYQAGYKMYTAIHSVSSARFDHSSLSDVCQCKQAMHW
jgi:Coatomer beta C-terminal region